MHANKIRKVVRFRFRKLERHYDQLKKHAHAEDIHNFRIEVKKTRAFLRLLNNEQEIKIPKSLKKVYDKAGVVRNLQLHRQTLHKAGNEADIKTICQLKHTGKQLDVAVRSLKKSTHSKLIKSSRRKINHKLPATLSVASIREFVDKKLMMITEVVSARPVTSDRWHDVRKKLKDIIYNSKTFQSDFSYTFPVPGWNSEREKYYTAVADEIGELLDSIIELEFLGADIVMDKKEKQVVTVLREQQRQIKSRKEKILEGKLPITEM